MILENKRQKIEIKFVSNKKNKYLCIRKRKTGHADMAQLVEQRIRNA